MAPIPNEDSIHPCYDYREYTSGHTAEGDLRQIQVLEQQTQILRRQIAAQTQLMHLLTHQVATPLTSLQGSVQLLNEPGLEPSQRQEFLAVVQQQVQRLQDLLQGLMALQDLETGALATHPTALSLPELVQEVAATLTIPSPTYHFSPTLPAAWGDRWQVTQVLTNLISNAHKYSATATPVEVGACLQGRDWIEVWVRDYGLGVPEIDQPHLFERFYRVRHQDRKDIPGTGLGLALCKLLVENQGGQIGFESTHGEGSRFYFTLPVVHQGLEQ